MYFPFCNLRFLPYQKPFCYDTVLSLNGHTAVIYQKFQQLFFIPYLNFSFVPCTKVFPFSLSHRLTSFHLIIHIYPIFFCRFKATVLTFSAAHGSCSTADMIIPTAIHTAILYNFKTAHNIWITRNRTARTAVIFLYLLLSSSSSSTQLLLFWWN